MSFKKGKAKTGGRTKGTPNALNQTLRERVKDLLESQFERVVSDLEALEPKDRVNAWLKLAEYVLPKLNRSEVVAEPGAMEIKTRYILPGGIAIDL